MKLPNATRDSPSDPDLGLVSEAIAAHNKPLADTLPEYLDLVAGPGDARRLNQCAGIRLEAL